jgi:hypothetical protein
MKCLFQFYLQYLFETFFFAPINIYRVTPREMRPETFVGLRMKFVLFLSCFNQYLNYPTALTEILRYELYRKYNSSGADISSRTDGHTLPPRKGFFITSWRKPNNVDDGGNNDGWVKVHATGRQVYMYAWKSECLYRLRLLALLSTSAYAKSIRPCLLSRVSTSGPACYCGISVKFRTVDPNLMVIYEFI